MHTKRLLVVLSLTMLTGTSGCYLLHLAGGQLRLLRASRSIEQVLADPATSDKLRAQLRLVLSVREFAGGLGLEVDDQYTRYAAWPGDRIVTSVVATRPGEITPAGFHFPLVGDVPYKGFFDPEKAAHEAERLAAQGLDTCVLAVPAYSTLGWFSDPITDPMLRGDEAGLVETVIHELVHATVFAESDANFNEGLATFVGQEGAVRFYAERGDEASMRKRVADDRAVQAELTLLREAIGELYASQEAGAAREARRSELEANARARLAKLPLEAQNAAALSERARLNDACLSIAGTYSADLPAHAAKLAALDDDLPAFIAEARQAAKAADPRTALWTSSPPEKP